MKLSKSILGLITAGSAILTLSATAVPIALNTVYTSDLGSSSSPGNLIQINWEVSTALGPNVYLYEYQVVNPPTDTTTVDFFNVSFNAIPGLNVLASGGGLFSQIVPGTGVDWNFGPLQPGTSTGALNPSGAGALWFTSPDAPTLGNANAQDSNPPSPWASTSPGGQQVAIPNVPDGGLTVAFVGFALVGVESLRRKFLKK